MKDNKLPNIGHVTTEIIDGLRIRLSRSGRSDGLPILFTSPWPESIYSFHRVLPYFAERYPVIAIDLPGFGHSESRPNVMSPRAMGDFLVKVARHLNLNRLHGVGPDVGELAFLFAAADNPGLFESLAVGGAATRVDLASGRLNDIIASPKGAFAAIVEPRQFLPIWPKPQKQRPQLSSTISGKPPQVGDLKTRHNLFVPTERTCRY